MKNFSLLFLVSILLTGCGFFQPSMEQGSGNHEQQNRQGPAPVHVKNSAPNQMDRQTNEEIANHLAHLATQNPEVKNATAVVLGDYAVIGLDVDEHLERSKVGTIKYAVAESLKKDPHGARAIVIADADMNARLNKVREDIKNNRPVQGILNELAEITGRWMPEIPGDLHDSRVKKIPEKQKQSLDNSERQQLDKEQHDQSNQHKNKHD